MLLDYHVHAVAHGEYDYSPEWICKFLARAGELGLQEIGLAEHDEYRELVNRKLIEEIQGQFPAIKIRRGLEVDFIPGRERVIKEFLASGNYDYVIGSVHFIDGWGFDHPDFRQGFDSRDIDEIYREYFNLVKKAAESGLFDIIGHIDLIKIWGHRPYRHDIALYLEPVLRSIKAQGIVIEINSGGMRKPVGEIYPAPEILHMMKDLDIPITLGSDAHHPDQVGEGLQQAARLAGSAGYHKVVRFESRRQIPALLLST